MRRNTKTMYEWRKSAGRRADLAERGDETDIESKNMKWSGEGRGIGL